MSDRSKATGLDSVTLAFVQEVRRKFHPQVQSNPIPSAPTYTWRTLPDGSWVGARKGAEPIVITKATPAPAHRIRFDRGTVTRTLADGVGVVIMDGHPKRKPKAKGNWGTVHAQFLPAVAAPDRKANKAKGIVAPKAPSWRQEVAGWSLEHRAERGAPCLFDQCGGGKVDPRKCSLPRSGIDVTPPHWNDPQAGTVVTQWRLCVFGPDAIADFYTYANA